MAHLLQIHQQGGALSETVEQDLTDNRSGIHEEVAPERDQATGALSPDEIFE
jgi:hypothetical protein